MQRYPEYKDSGIEWIGEIPKDWAYSKLRYHLSESSGGIWGEDDDFGTGTYVLRSTEITLDGSWNLQDLVKRELGDEDTEKFLVQRGDLIVTKSSGSQDHIGKTGLVGKEIESMNACYSNFVQRIRPNDRLNSKFLHYFMNCPIAREQYKYQSETTTGLANLSKQSIGNLLISIPFTQEQTQIVAFLDRKTQKIDELIRVKERKIELLGEYRASLIHQAVTKGIDPNAEMKPSGVEWIGEIPKHWGCSKLKLHLSENSGGIWGEDDDFDTGTYVLRSTEITIDGNWNLRNLAKRRLSNEEAERFVLKKGDLVITKSSGSQDHIGKTGRVDEEIESMVVCYSNFVQRVRPKGHMDSKFLHYFMNCPIAREQYKYQSETTTGLANLSKESIRNLLVSVPPMQEQAHIVTFLDHKTKQIDELRSTEEQIIKLLKEYRQSLISAVVTGKIDVRNEV